MNILSRVLVVVGVCFCLLGLDNNEVLATGSSAHGHEHAPHSHDGTHDSSPQGSGHSDSDHQDSAHHDSGAEHHAPIAAPIINWTDLGYRNKDEHGGSLDKGEAHMAPPLLFAIFNFLVFVGLLYWKAGPAIKSYVANRHNSIKNALEEAAKLQAEAKKKLQEYSDRIADADKEVDTLISQIRKDAEEERKKLIAEAEKQAAQMKKDTDDRIESDFIAAKRQLEREVVAKATAVAERLINEKSSDVDHNTLFATFITDLKTQHDSNSKGVS